MNWVQLHIAISDLIWYYLKTEGVKTTAGDYNQKQLAKRVDTGKIAGDVVENWLKSAEDRKTLVFAVNVKHSIALRDEFINADVPAEHLDARSTDEERERVFDRIAQG